MSDEKPKKSWREIDKMRDRSGGGASRRDAHDREKFESSTGYTKYKTNLDRLFTGGLAGAPPEQDEEQKKLYAIEDQKLFYAAATEYLKKNAIPDDPRVLDRLLTHPDDDVQEKALTRLEELHKAGSLKVPPALTQRLASVEIDSGDPRIRKRAAELRKAIR